MGPQVGTGARTRRIPDGRGSSWPGLAASWQGGSRGKGWSASARSPCSPVPVQSKLAARAGLNGLEGASPRARFLGRDGFSRSGRLASAGAGCAGWL